MEIHSSSSDLSRPPKRLSLNIQDAANTPLPPSSPARHKSDSPRNISSPAIQRPSPSPLRRCSSSMSLDHRASSPALGRRTSLASMRNPDSPASSPKLSNRRSSSNLLMSSLAPAVEEPPPPTASSIAAAHFAAELALHDQTGSKSSKTLVVVHDSCYGHRFSRPRTKQADLNLIVERPERLRASVMGVAAAYVRLGERHAAGRYAPHPKIPPSSQLPFRILKTTRTVPLDSAAAVAVHGKELMSELETMCQNAAAKLAATGREVERTDKDKRSFHSGDLYLCSETIHALQGALGGVFDAVDSVFQGVQSGQGPSQAFVCIRPPGHHCSSDFPSGFCWLNNVHIGIQHAIQKHGLTHAAIIDFDLHHGDGSQEVAWGHNEHMFYPEKPTPLSKRPFIGYYSLHDINSFPCEGGDREKVQNASLCIDNAHGQSIWNVHLRPWKTLDEFWELYEQRYLVLLEKARAFLKHQTDERLRAKGNQLPKAAIFISAGFDASEHEGGGMQRHKVNVPTEFYARFTKDIVALAQEQGTSVEGRVISVLEGGYSNKALMSGVLSHISGLCDGSDDIVDAETELINGMASIGLSGLAAAPTATSNVMTYNTEWWHSSNLDILDSILDPTPIAVAAPIARKVRLATYSSPTQASTLRAIDPLKVRLNHRQLSSHSPSRPASPPPPDVDWQTAATELSNLLIPSDRETRSHTAVQLAEPKVKKERPSASSSDDLVPPTAVTGGRTLRDRKPKATTAFQPPAPEKPTTSRKSSVDRRKTIAEALPNPKAPEKATRVPKRRTSIASTVSTTSVAPHLPKSNAHRKGDQERPRVTKSLSNGIDVKKTRLVGPQTSNREMPPIQRTASANTVKMEPPESSQGDVMDELTSSIKRITIKVPSNEEYASRQKKAGVNGNSKALASKRAPALKASGATKGASNAVGAKKTSLPTSIKSIKPASNVGPQEKEALVKNEPTNGSTPIQQPPAIAGSEKDRVVPEMEQQLQPPHQYPVIQWLAPNTDPALPTEAQDQVQLPQTYSGTEFIPFMPPGSQRQQ